MASKTRMVGAGGFDGMSASGHLEAMRRAAVPARVSASWLDGVTALGALTRFNALRDVPMEVVIGATTHSGALDADPFSLQFCARRCSAGDAGCAHAGRAPLLPLAALVRKGHHLRLSFAGADAGTFPLLSDEPARWSVAYGRHGSSLTLPIKPWSQHD